MSISIERLSSTMLREISKILEFEVRDDALHMVTVTEVRITNDLSYATIYYTVMGSSGHQKKVADLLERAKGFIRSTLAKRVSSRKMPELIFKYDEALAYGNKINEILKEIN